MIITDKLLFKNASTLTTAVKPVFIPDELAQELAGPRQYSQNLEEIMKAEVPEHWPQWPKENARREALVHAIQTMDLAVVEAEANELADMNSRGKAKIIQELGVTFKKLKTAGDTFLNAHIGHCMGKRCNFFCKGYSFVGNHSGMYFDLVIKMKDDVAQEITECMNFKNNELDIRKVRRIDLDEERIPF